MGGATIPDVHGALVIGRSICLPDDPAWIGIVSGLLVRATKSYYWDGETGDVDQAVQTMKNILWAWIEQDCAMPPEIDFREEPDNTLQVKIGDGEWETIYETTESITNINEDVDIDNAQTGIGRFEITAEPSPPAGSEIKTAKLYLNHDMLKGEKGDQGLPGQDGQDGQDGLPGQDGQDGLPGQDGQDGQDGLPGEKGDKGDPGECNCEEPPDPSGENGEAKRCNIATGAGSYLFSQFQHFIDEVQAGITAGIAAEVMLSGIFDAIPVLGAFPDALLDAITATVVAGAASVQAAFSDPDTQDLILCTLYCLMDETGQISDATYSAWISMLNTLLDEPLKTPFVGFLEGVDRAKFRTRAYGNAGLTAVCAFCVCEEPEFDWEIELNLKNNEYAGCLFDQNSSLTWVDGKGYVTDGALWYGILSFFINVTGTSHLTQVITQYRSKLSGPVSGEANLDKFEITIAGGTPDTMDLAFDYPLSVKTRNMSKFLSTAVNNNLIKIGAVTGAVVGITESLTLEKIVLRGTEQRPTIPGGCDIDA